MLHVGSARIRLLILFGDNMNKKLATLLFAIGLGASAGSALAFGPFEPTCAQQCFKLFQACGVNLPECQYELSTCRDRCGI